MDPSSAPSNVLAFDRAKRPGHRILIVEDEMLIALDLIDKVAALGMSSVAASRLAIALDYVATQPFDAALVDLKLAGWPADAVLDALSARGIPFIITTGYGTDGIAEKYRESPRLTKPYMSAQLEAALRGVLAPSPLLAVSG